MVSADTQPYLIIVEGKHDRARLRRLVPESVEIELTYGIPSTERLGRLAKRAKHRQVVIFTDADATGRRIRGILGEAFPDAYHLYTKVGYQGVEHTPLDYLTLQLQKLGLGETDAGSEGSSLRDESR